ncbi:hypothetical protein Q31b_39320 [Novipirellula aureliae]|uniref:Uncharacterized protein n=1 Tax=Novipirellula aureliae TaxID=2527966 RepID=A0A5C6DRL6_9BACT|nr:hypothetical protein Q31b_39320 [Novipirellula aureliae]
MCTASSCRKRVDEPSLAGDEIQSSERTASVWDSVFPDGLVDEDGVDVPREHLEGKVVGLYFSASSVVGGQMREDKGY